ncbi:MAG: hypothetical protein ACRCSK_06330 [Fusobacteriaceae bacterium]
MESEEIKGLRNISERMDARDICGTTIRFKSRKEYERVSTRGREIMEENEKFIKTIKEKGGKEILFLDFYKK